MPKGGLGNLIALPLQKKAREKNPSVFLDENRSPYTDQWAFLASIHRMERATVEAYVQNSLLHKEVLPVAIEARDDAEDDEPWKASRTAKWPVITEALAPAGGRGAFEPGFRGFNRSPRDTAQPYSPLASSRIRNSTKPSHALITWGKPRILYCYELFPKHIAITDRLSG